MDRTGTNATSTTGYISVSNNNQGFISIDSVGGWGNASSGMGMEMSAKMGTTISPQLYFKYIKKKFGTLEGMKLSARLKKLEKAFYKAVENGQDALGEKFMKELVRETRESMIYAKGFKHFIEFDDLHKYKRKIRNGHISDTKFEQYTRVIPQDVLDKKKKTEGLFDGYVIYHYWSPEASDVKKMSESERAAMRDPVLFGVIAESNRLYFVADWEDEFCDLTFEEIIDVVGGPDEDYTITRFPKL